MFVTLNHGCDSSSCQANVIFNLGSEGYTKFNFLNIYFRRLLGEFMGVQDDASVTKVDVSSDIVESQIKLETPFLCSFLQYHLGDDGEFFNEIIHSPEKVKSLLSGDKRKHYNFFKQGLNVASHDVFNHEKKRESYDVDDHFGDVLEGAVGALCELGYEVINVFFLEIINELDSEQFQELISNDLNNWTWIESYSSRIWEPNNTLTKGVILFRALRLMNDPGLSVKEGVKRGVVSDTTGGVNYNLFFTPKTSGIWDENVLDRFGFYHTFGEIPTIGSLLDLRTEVVSFFTALVKQGKTFEQLTFNELNFYDFCSAFSDLLTKYGIPASSFLRRRELVTLARSNDIESCLILSGVLLHKGLVDVCEERSGCILDREMGRGSEFIFLPPKINTKGIFYLKKASRLGSILASYCLSKYYGPSDVRTAGDFAIKRDPDNIYTLRLFSQLESSYDEKLKDNSYADPLIFDLLFRVFNRDVDLIKDRVSDYFRVFSKSPLLLYSTVPQNIIRIEMFLRAISVGVDFDRNQIEDILNLAVKAIVSMYNSDEYIEDERACARAIPEEFMGMSWGDEEGTMRDQLELNSIRPLLKQSVDLYVSKQIGLSVLDNVLRELSECTEGKISKFLFSQFEDFGLTEAIASGKLEKVPSSYSDMLFPGTFYQKKVLENLYPNSSFDELMADKEIFHTLEVRASNIIPDPVAVFLLACFELFNKEYKKALLMCDHLEKVRVKYSESFVYDEEHYLIWFTLIDSIRQDLKNKASEPTVKPNQLCSTLVLFLYSKPYLTDNKRGLIWPELLTLVEKGDLALVCSILDVELQKDGFFVVWQYGLKKLNNLTKYLLTTDCNKLPASISKENYGIKFWLYFFDNIRTKLLSNDEWDIQDLEQIDKVWGQNKSLIKKRFVDLVWCYSRGVIVDHDPDIVMRLCELYNELESRSGSTPVRTDSEVFKYLELQEKTIHIHDPDIYLDAVKAIFLGNKTFSSQKDLFPIIKDFSRIDECSFNSYTGLDEHVKDELIGKLNSQNISILVQKLYNYAMTGEAKIEEDYEEEFQTSFDPSMVATSMVAMSTTVSFIESAYDISLFNKRLLKEGLSVVNEMPSITDELRDYILFENYLELNTEAKYAFDRLESDLTLLASCSYVLGSRAGLKILSKIHKMHEVWVDRNARYFDALFLSNRHKVPYLCEWRGVDKFKKKNQEIIKLLELNDTKSLREMFWGAQRLFTIDTLVDVMNEQMSGAYPDLEMSRMLVDSDKKTKKYEQAINTHKLILGKNSFGKSIYPGDIRKRYEELLSLQKERDEHRREVDIERAKKEEVENLMAMFAHKFRGPLDSIIYNQKHENDPKLFHRAIDTMIGLLEIFSAISSSPEILVERVRSSLNGKQSLEELLLFSLGTCVRHLLNVSNKDKISQHFWRYALQNQLIPDTASIFDWDDGSFLDIQVELQKEWDEYFDDKLFTDTSEVLIEKIQARFFSLELVGFKDCDLRFTAYGYASSIFTIILNELITNAFKYYSSENHLPVVLEWIETSEHGIIKCVTPSSKEERDVSKGSHKGHNFLNTLAEKLGGKFEIIPLEADEDLFCVEFKIPNDMFCK